MNEAEQIRRLTEAVERLNELVGGSGATMVDNGSTAAEIILSLVPLLGVVFGCVLLFFFLLWQYRIRRELIRTGQHQPMFVTNIRMLSLLIGLLGIAAGLPMTLLFVLIEGVTYVLLGGLLPFFAGIGFLIFYALTRSQVARPVGGQNGNGA
jgi:type IV secretory pathway TrbD component